MPPLLPCSRHCLSVVHAKNSLLSENHCTVPSASSVKNGGSADEEEEEEEEEDGADAAAPPEEAADELERRRVKRTVQIGRVDASACGRREGATTQHTTHR
jgi:hypothetical protein